MERVSGEDRYEQVGPVGTKSRHGSFVTCVDFMSTALEHVMPPSSEANQLEGNDRVEASSTGTSSNSPLQHVVTTLPCATKHVQQKTHVHVYLVVPSPVQIASIDRWCGGMFLQDERLGPYLHSRLSPLCHFFVPSFEMFSRTMFPFPWIISMLRFTSVRLSSTEDIMFAYAKTFSLHRRSTPLHFSAIRKTYVR